MLPLGGGRSFEPLFFFLIHIEKKQWIFQYTKVFFLFSPLLPNGQSLASFLFPLRSWSPGDVGLGPCPSLYIPSLLPSGRSVQFSLNSDLSTDASSRRGRQGEFSVSSSATGWLSLTGAEGEDLPKNSHYNQLYLWSYLYNLIL